MQFFGLEIEKFAKRGYLATEGLHRAHSGSVSEVRS